MIMIKSGDRREVDIGSEADDVWGRGEAEAKEVPVGAAMDGVGSDVVWREGLLEAPPGRSPEWLGPRLAWQR